MLSKPRVVGIFSSALHFLERSCGFGFGFMIHCSSSFSIKPPNHNKYAENTQNKSICANKMARTENGMKKLRSKVNEIKLWLWEWITFMKVQNGERHCISPRWALLKSNSIARTTKEFSRCNQLTVLCSLILESWTIPYKCLEFSGRINTHTDK